jgi:predicted transcriptional regulator with HTH domain
MTVSPSDVARSFVRSRTRRRVLLALSSLSEASPSQLARAARVDERRLRWVVHGHLPEFSPGLSLGGLGLVVEGVSDAGFRVFRITAAGRRQAHGLRVRQARAVRVARPSVLDALFVDAP